MTDRAIMVILGVIFATAVGLLLIYPPIPSNVTPSPEEPELIHEEIVEEKAVERPEVIEQPPPEPPRAIEAPQITAPHLVINGRVITVEIVDTPEARSRGLMFRDPLPDDHGMLFIFEGAGMHSFWMMNMKFNLDILWIDNNGVVVHIERDLPFCSQNCPSYTPKAPAVLVLEVNSGVADTIGVKEGDAVQIKLSN